MKKKIICIGIISMFLLTSLMALQGVGINIAVTADSLDDSITLDPVHPNEFGWYNTPVDVTFHAKEGEGPGTQSGLKYIYHKINDGTWIMHEIPGKYPDLPLEYDYTITIDADGEFTVYFYAVDYVGNIGSLHQSPTIKIDTTPPSITLSKDEIKFGEVKFIADADDATSGIYYVAFDSEPTGELPNLPYTDTTSPYEWLFTGIHNYMIKATVYDHAGNHAESNTMSTPHCRNLQKPSNILGLKILEKFIDQFLLLSRLIVFQ